MELWISGYIIIILMAPSSQYESQRSLVITSGGNIKVIVGLSMPVELPVSMNWIQNIQFQYPMIDNATQLSYLSLLRSGRNILSRNIIYKLLAHSWDSLGSNGTACVLRTICDIARYPLSHNGIFGEILDSIFTPHNNTDEVYKEARKVGTLRNNCRRIFYSCKNSILNLFSRLM